MFLNVLKNILKLISEKTNINAHSSRIKKMLPFVSMNGIIIYFFTCCIIPASLLEILNNLESIDSDTGFEVCSH